MLDVLLDWAGDAYVDEAKLAADVNELVFEYEDVPLKSIRIGNVVRHFSRDRARALDRAALRPLHDVQGAHHAGGPGPPVRPGRPHHRSPGAAPAQRARRALPARGAAAARARARLPVSSISWAACRAISRGCCARRGAARPGSTWISSGSTSSASRMERTIDRGTMGVMTASLVIGSAIVMCSPGRADASSAIPVLTTRRPGRLPAAFVNSVWIIYGMWRSRGGRGG